MQNRSDLYTRVTDSIIASLERGVRPWTKPWAGGGPVMRPLRHTGEPYRGINVLLLWTEADEKGYSSPHWMTFRQASELGAHVRKGEHGTTVVYTDRFSKTATNEDGEEVESHIRFLRAYTVFNVEQIEGLPEKYRPAAPAPREAKARIASADTFFSALNATVIHGGNRAFYRPSTDDIHMPALDAFDTSESYYATLAHEHVHWTMHSSRLARDFGSERWGDDGYAVEELVAELGAAFLCADLELTLEPREDHASYLASWLTALKNDRRAIFQAAAYAQKACDYLRDPSPPSGGEQFPQPISDYEPRVALSA